VNVDYLSVAGIIIDDIILPDGTKYMNILGGGLTHAVMGMRVWSDQVGMISSVGEDFDPNLMALLMAYFDLSGLKVIKDKPTPRAWQVLEEDGTRHETFQTDIEDMQDAIPKPAELPGVYPAVKGVHLLCPPSEVGEWVPALRERQCGVILWEPWDEYCRSQNRDIFRWTSQQVDIVSPNLLEGRLVTGLDDPGDIARKIQDDGARMVALRMAEAGSLVLDAQGCMHHVPAYPADNIIDVTGAGNAYCGGFVVGYATTGDARSAGWYGAVSASLALHQYGALYPLEGLRQKARSRLAWYEDGFNQE
jgi:sugar/nucleoside kinase (ribokinase family)